MRLLSFCGALAAGEYLASFVSCCAEVWPMVALVALLVFLFGYGLSWRGWPLIVTFLLGACLYLRASVSVEQTYREKPWTRGREWMLRPTADNTSFAATVRRNLSRRVAIGLEGDRETVALERAILLGERYHLPRRMKRLFVASGTMHVFAISGLHVMAIANLLTWVLALTFLPRRVVGIAAVPVLWGYVAVIGCPPSAVRAATMATLSLLAPLFWRRADGLRAWMLAFLIIHLADPLKIIHVGNALSFAVMLAIVLAGDCVRGISRLGQTLCVSLAAWIVGVPIAAHVFGCVTPGGLLANLVLIVAARLTVITGAVGLGVSFLSSALARYVNNLGAFGIRLMVIVADAVSRLPGAKLETGNWSLPMCALWYASLILSAFLAVRIIRRQRML